ncbi:Gfo/Idh/MocA family protein [Lederbergia galactosidilytica]|uniref:Dehydrogenase n=1 Tax=Lederbergia galactosidilytica TaxID=217031 RepID=A0A0Q9Y6Z2_9BACI|nr:Gfo/Idh/MocA family oxidoreductase [Lederbergia galactosidilytica]KRG11969.1 dehydrogenase [Lederbergia galactosidilytica]KRG15474.1 dehydrogenase [Virgibacillus soli]MBP1917505.1 putative dehydrogenase [Lederbergia galactosidilytica]OAK68374.1 dehydrogenase [Lederbergia galactosidilytica]
MQTILLIGAGTMGKTHLRAYKKMKNVKVVGIVDIRGQGTLELEKNDIAFFSTVEEAIRAIKQVDVLDICLPTYLHQMYIQKAALFVKNIICEKPLARNMEEAEEIKKICQQNNIKLFIGHVTRFFPEYERAKKLIDTKAIGNPGMIRTTRNGRFPTGWNHWYENVQNSGGVILDLLIHDFDFLCWCFGKVKRVYAKSLAGREFSKREYALVTLRFDSGIIAHVEGSWSHDSFYRKFEFAGDEGNFEYDSRDYSINIIEKERTIGQNPLHDNPYERQLAHFMECIEKDIQPNITVEDAYEALKVALAALHSIETKQAIIL